MPYSELMVTPMRQELTRLGVIELTNAQQVDHFIADHDHTALLLVNSVCGCAAGAARPAVALALDLPNKPDRFASVFAGQDTEATQQARSHFPQLPPTSPSIILIKNGQADFYLPRHRIENRTPHDIANELAAAFDQLKNP